MTAVVDSSNGKVSFSDVAWQDLETSDLYVAVHEYVRQYMNRYDCSHDFSHILRVVRLAKLIAAEELQAGSHEEINRQIVLLAALLHDVGDKKYILPDEDSTSLISSLLTRHGCPPQLILQVVQVVEHVSYSFEMSHPQQVEAMLQTCPELAIVQDADRLDAIGAIGIGRCFSYGAIKQPDRGLDGSLNHFTDKLERIEKLMKTNTGRRLAKERTRRLIEFRGWWQEEQMVGSSHEVLDTID